eukprot:3930743-Rhodomonas_salina.1
MDLKPAIALPLDLNVPPTIIAVLSTYGVPGTGTRREPGYPGTHEISQRDREPAYPWYPPGRTGF